MSDLPILDFHPNYRQLVLTGEKKTTIRYQNDLQEGEIEIQFNNEGELFPAEIVQLEERFLQDLTEADARSDGFASRQELIAALRFHYPNLPENPELTIIHFHLRTNPILRNENDDPRNQSS